MKNMFKFTFHITKSIRFSLMEWFFIRWFIVLMLNILYYSFKWEFLVVWLGNTLAFMYQHFLGIDTSFAMPNFTGSLYGITILGKACTYLEIYAYMIPFMYDTRKTVFKNILFILSVVAVVQIINILRVFTSVWWRISFDVPRWLYHDLPDTLIWYPICIGSMVYASFKFHPIGARIEKVEKDE